MSELWRKSLATLARQFESNSMSSPSLYCMVVEASENRRERLSGPPPGFWRKDADEFAFGCPGMTGPDIRPLTSEEAKTIEEGGQVEGLLRIGSDKDRELLGVRIPMLLRSSHYWGNPTGYDRFRSLSADTWRCVLDAPGAARAMLPRELAEPCLAKTRELGSGVIVIPDVGPPEAADCWLRTLFHLAWQKPRGVPLRSTKCIWEGNSSYPHDEAQLHVLRGIAGHDIPEPTDFFYSIMGGRAEPQDMSLSSLFAISILLGAGAQDRIAAKNPFDVFVAYNTEDKSLVLRICEQLKRRKLRPWIDTEQVPPGFSFQEAIQRAIPNVNSAAVFIGPSGLGSWQSLELKTLTSQFIERGLAVIPALLPGVPVFPPDLLFLKEFNWVQFFDTGDDLQALDRLEWGITGQKPFGPSP